MVQSCSNKEACADTKVIKNLSTVLEKHFYTLVRHPQGDNSDGLNNLALISRALARSFIIVESGGPSSRDHLWDTLSRFCSVIGDIGRQLEKEESEQTANSKSSYQLTTDGPS